MKKIFIYSIILFFIISLVPSAYSMSVDKRYKKLHKKITVSNKLFYFKLPENIKGKYIAKKKNDAIFIYDKASKKAGFGGFAFGVKAYLSPSDYAMGPGVRKVGELTDKKGVLYDIVIISPTDVQYDYVKGESETYNLLYNWGSSPEKDIRGVNGAKYLHRQGTLGKDLYREVLGKHLTAIEEKWDSAKLEKENMSYMYNVIAQKEDCDVLNTIGYAYYDLNGDGIEELLIGEIAEGEWKGVIYDIYTMVNREPKHVVSGGNRDRYYACDDSFVCNEASSGANDSRLLVYILVENSTELYPQVGFKYDGYENSKSPWFISYDFKNDKWENVSEEKFIERKMTFDRYERFDFIPLSTIK